MFRSLVVWMFSCWNPGMWEFKVNPEAIRLFGFLWLYGIHFYKLPVFKKEVPFGQRNKCNKIIDIENKKSSWFDDFGADAGCNF
ncbi:hypothetical protein FPE01S_01_10690 [Flavihumibacter petaseus NBRC 106054]|uniref:Uncharacterized protein n=1 Tax=Flavihumibacter petaseus NBRC 106054 TaxID=1220578 RepID=A0A0E9MXB5_9BACT|nr:hypothetical protein FPE01S_01_10690 [Flavihumibacter petaseus NBRC 106054]